MQTLVVVVDYPLCPLNSAPHSRQIGVVYIIGAFAGSGASSIFDPE